MVSLASPVSPNSQGFTSQVIELGLCVRYVPVNVTDTRYQKGVL
jgi:hypothetical protein